MWAWHISDLLVGPGTSQAICVLYGNLSHCVGHKISVSALRSPLASGRHDVCLTAICSRASSPSPCLLRCPPSSRTMCVDPDLGPLHVVNVLLLSHSGHTRGPHTTSLRASCTWRAQHVGSWIFRANLVGRPVKNGDAHLKHTATEKTAAVPVAEAESTKVLPHSRLAVP